jgi:DNA invertase Pin-like site-specific DNA recombinase
VTVKGYARVSTDGQTLDAQQAALKEAGAEQIFAEKISGAVTDRKALARLVASLSPNDVVLITKLDRLARSTRDLLNTLAAIAEAGGSFKSLGDPWAEHKGNTRQPTDRHMADVVAPRDLSQRLTRCPSGQSFAYLMLRELGASAELDPSGLRTTAPFGCPTEIRWRSNSASPPNTVSIRRPCGVVVQ